MSLHNSTSRRDFLKLSAAAATAASLGTDAHAADPLHITGSSIAGPSDSATQSTTLLAFVNPLQGTNSNFDFSRGNTLPIVALPFGTAHWTLQSVEQEGWFFDPHQNRLEGIRCTHQLSPWLGDYGYATFLPYTGTPSPDASSRASSYRPSDMSISPAYLKMHLMRYRCGLELTPTERCCAMRITFEDADRRGMFIDLPGDAAEAVCDPASGTVTALTRANHGGVHENFATYYFVRFSAPIDSFSVQRLQGRRVAIVRFSSSADQSTEVRIGASFISYSQAQSNLDREIGTRTFDTLRDMAEKTWEAALSRVRIAGKTEREHQTFYSCLYRTLLFPRMWHEPDASGHPIHRSPYNGNVESGVLYADHGFWDDYHTWYPMMALVFSERLGEILQGWVNAYREGGWLPQFPCPGYRGAMTGSPSDIIFGDAAAKGVKGFDLPSAFIALKKQAMQPVEGHGYGRPRLAPYLKLGYVPADNGEASVAETLDYAYGDFCISQVARALNKTEDQRFFRNRSANWRNIFDPETKFFRGKLTSGAWKEPFDSLTWGGPYVEGGPWQYRFNVPYDPQGLMQAFGGNQAFIAQLEKMFNQPPWFNVGTYGAEIHEMSEMAAANFGQYAQSNQPVHNVLYLFTLAGRRDRTQFYAHKVMEQLYSPDNFPGDEDTGSMSAWYVLSALGIFPACPGDSRWTLGAPFFDSATVRSEGGQTLQIDAPGTGNGKFLKRVTLNDLPTDGMTVEHADLTNAHLLFATV